MALLAGLPQAPSRYSPLRYPERARKRRIYVLRRMKEEGFISAEELQAAEDTQIRVYGAPNTSRDVTPISQSTFGDGSWKNTAGQSAE